MKRFSVARIRELAWCEKECSELSLRKERKCVLPIPLTIGKRNERRYLPMFTTESAVL